MPFEPQPSLIYCRLLVVFQFDFLVDAFFRVWSTLLESGLISQKYNKSYMSTLSFKPCLWIFRSWMQITKSLTVALSSASLAGERTEKVYAALSRILSLTFISRPLETCMPQQGLSRSTTMAYFVIYQNKDLVFY